MDIPLLHKRDISVLFCYFLPDNPTVYWGSRFFLSRINLSTRQENITRHATFGCGSFPWKYSLHLIVCWKKDTVILGIIKITYIIDAMLYFRSFLTVIFSTRTLFCISYLCLKAFIFCVRLWSIHYNFSKKDINVYPYEPHSLRSGFSGALGEWAILRCKYKSLV